ncbi:MDR family MFS transporter [Cellulomonas chengniuliangii]|uniref:MFS transporter n=1 Tax=Cellulomonas chengniuliangii TaxID=2968084 RepID=A0ABY5L0Q7_9CELL|nr:MFS transporter [Cellulomonas chengniuliangii]MCC2309444.1 MFS transporter [Cellulomonas chengniuliangii]MCC2316715.1 MFS transporter [Cellulomonas chengniuliangii]UUI74995.1 MFS transporter [Cellulomonas chengniuliangii]
MTPVETAAHTRLRDLPATFWWLWTAQLVVWIGRFVVPYMTIFLTSSIGMSAAGAGLVVAAYGVGVVVSSLAGGVLADRIGRRKVLLGSELLSVLVLVAIPLVDGALLIAALLTVYGLFNGAAGPVIHTMVGDLVEPRHRRAAFNYNYWAVNLGYAIGPLAAGFMAMYSFSLLFWCQAALVLVSTAVLAVKVPETRLAVPDAVGPERPAGAADPADLAVTPAPPTARGAERGAGGRGGGLVAVLGDRVFMTFAAVMFVYSVVYVQSTTTLPLVMTQQGHPSSHFGLLLTLNGLLLCVLQLPTARLLNRWSRDIVIAVAITLTAVGVGLQAAAASLAMYFVAVAIWTLGEMGSHPQATSITADLAHPERRGRYQGVYGVTHSLAMAVGPVLGGLVLDHHGAKALWLGASGLSLVVAVLMAVTSKSRQRRIAEVLAADAAARAKSAQVASLART